jgi:Zn finger protein HypA/HybF (possibly regulating hydrogenase expression)
MSGLVSAILEELKNYKVVRVTEVVLTIGKLTNLGTEQMEFAYDIMTKDTILEGSKLVIEEEPIEVLCNSCSYEGPTKNAEFGDAHGSVPVLSCPECGSAIKLTKGQACCVKTVDIEEEA